ncbi:MAG: hypothetical protein KF878_22920, partial [Planctomycetes bacterium]|nr:hypothetical protein [Planctomycetota bacterium]
MTGLPPEALAAGACLAAIAVGVGQGLAGGAPWSRWPLAILGAGLLLLGAAATGAAQALGL